MNGYLTLRANLARLDDLGRQASERRRHDRTRAKRRSQRTRPSPARPKLVDPRLHGSRPWPALTGLVERRSPRTATPESASAGAPLE